MRVFLTQIIKVTGNPIVDIINENNNLFQNAGDQLSFSRNRINSSANDEVSSWLRFISRENVLEAIIA